MAALFADENVPLALVELLRDLGHDALTALQAGRANQRIPELERIGVTLDWNGSDGSGSRNGSDGSGSRWIDSPRTIQHGLAPGKLGKGG
jgi:hypothetical protein